MTTKFYKGYEIISEAFQITNTSEWTVDVNIRYHKGAQIVDRQYQGPDETYPSKEKAIIAGLLYGEQIIDTRPDQLP